MIFTHHHRVFDGWSLVHFLSGAGLALLALLVGISFELATLVTVILVVGWEFWERFTGIGEPLPNVISDIILGILGFFSFWYIFIATFTATQTKALFVVILAQVALLVSAYLFRRKH